MENQSKAACWPEMENVKMCNYVHLQALFGWSISISAKYSLPIWAHYGVLVGSLRLNNRKGLASDIFDTFNTFQHCSWRHWSRLLGTKWQHSGIWQWLNLSATGQCYLAELCYGPCLVHSVCLRWPVLCFAIPQVFESVQRILRKCCSLLALQSGMRQARCQKGE